MHLFSGFGIALGVTSLFAVIMTGVTTVLCCKLRSQGSTDTQKLVGTSILYNLLSLFPEGTIINLDNKFYGLDTSYRICKNSLMVFKIRL